jgi:hypothetical protein
MEKEKIEYLLFKAEDGRLSLEELHAILDEIREFQDNPNAPKDVEIHMLLQIIGYAGAFNHNSIQIQQECRGLVEKFLFFPTEPFVTVSALDVLCNDWDLTHDYIEQIKSFMKGVEWDESEHIRVKAMGVAGEYVKETGDIECLKILLEIFENKQERNVLRETAYYYICRALGQKHVEISDIHIEDFPQNQSAQEIIAQAYQVLERNKAK